MRRNFLRIFAAFIAAVTAHHASAFAKAPCVQVRLWGEASPACAPAPASPGGAALIARGDGRLKEARYRDAVIDYLAAYELGDGDGACKAALVYADPAYARFNRRLLGLPALYYAQFERAGFRPLCKLAMGWAQFRPVTPNASPDRARSLCAEAVNAVRSASGYLCLVKAIELAGAKQADDIWRQRIFVRAALIADAQSNGDTLAADLGMVVLEGAGAPPAPAEIEDRTVCSVIDAVAGSVAIPCGARVGVEPLDRQSGDNGR